MLKNVETLQPAEPIPAWAMNAALEIANKRTLFALTIAEETAIIWRHAKEAGK